MRRILLRRVPLAVAMTFALLVALVSLPVEGELVFRTYALVLAAILFATLSAATAFAARRTRSEFAEAMKKRRAPRRRPEALERLERQVALGVENAADFHFRLRPSLVEVADAVVWRRHALPLERAAHVVPPELWEAVRPDAPAPEDRRAAGPTLERVETVLDGIERMSR